MTATVPPLTEPRAAAELSLTERHADSGLRMLAVRKPGIPLVEVRLRVPMLGADPAHAALLADSLLTGAAGLDRAGLASAIQALGADLSVGVDADRLVISGNVLSPALPQLLDLLAAVLTEPLFDADEVATERDRLVERLTIARSRAGVIAAERLAERMWGAHPYARDLPQPEAVAATSPDMLATLHAGRVRPSEAVLVLVGDLDPEGALALAASALATWTGSSPAADVPPLPTSAPRPLLIVDRDGSVQSSLRMGAVSLGRLDEDYPALQLANLVFGGYFSSRWTANLREDKGYTYGPHSRISHDVLGSTLTLEAEVASEVTAPSMLETLYELGRIAALPVRENEVDDARQYAIGTLALSTATQAGLASTLSALSPFDLGLDWIAGHPARLTATSIDEVSEAATRFFAPSAFTSVVVGDASTITTGLAALGPVES